MLKQKTLLLFYQSTTIGNYLSSFRKCTIVIRNITNIAGRSIRQMNIANASSSKIDLTGIAPGMYHVILSNGTTPSIMKLIVEKAHSNLNKKAGSVSVFFIFSLGFWIL